MSGDLKSKVKDWWNGYPFTYFVKDDVGSWAFFRNVDRKILKWMHWAQPGYPLLSGFIDYKSLKGKKILDIACGTGWSTEQFARAGADVTAIDITPKAVELTKKRFELYGLEGNIIVADAENLPFESNSFDYVLAWGCLMHTPDTQKAINEINRVLKPEGKFGAMMYNKKSFHWRYFIWFGKGILKMKLFKYKKQELANRFTDGAEVGGNMLTKFFSKKEIKKMFGNFNNLKVDVYDTDDFINNFPHRFLPLGKFLPRRIKRLLARKWGLSLWIYGNK
ncbi:MAG: class I SAM-dependent methyltransferase [Candidatus Marinimicrobia bacterium]|nr:class I SAM-dependent methyltransferase [Candidatus Neomarinimicrobiota bacterium]